MSLVALIRGRRGRSGYGYASTAAEVTEGLDLDGKVIVITGVNSGLGQESARVFASRGAHVVGLARSVEKAEAALRPLGEHVTAVACELSEPTSVRGAVETIVEMGTPIDVLLCNAGVMALPKLARSHGYEQQFFTNHVGHFLLVTGLLESLAPEARVVMLSSDLHQMTYRGGIQFDNLSGEKGYSALRAYGQSKLANLLFARALARRFEGSGRTASAVHPGVIATNLSRSMPAWMRLLEIPGSLLFMKDVHQGAATQCYAAVHPGSARINGAYFVNCNVAEPSKHGKDHQLAERLWRVSEEIVQGLPS
jgi:WW domain-containing oxidoreductase